jgi:hypothetical protein
VCIELPCAAVDPMCPRCPTGGLVPLHRWRGTIEIDDVKSLDQGLDLLAVAVLVGLRNGCRERDDDGLDLKQAMVAGICLGA